MLHSDWLLLSHQGFEGPRISACSATEPDQKFQVLAALIKFWPELKLIKAVASIPCTEVSIAHDRQPPRLFCMRIDLELAEKQPGNDPKARQCITKMSNKLIEKFCDVRTRFVEF